MDPESDLFKYTVHYVTYNYETSNIMGMDAVLYAWPKNTTVLQTKAELFG